MKSKRCFIITGASRGLGYSILNEIILQSSEDDKILVLSRTNNIDGVDRLKFIGVDLSIPNWEKDIFEDINVFIQGIDEVIFVNNAGSITPIAKIGNYNNNEIDRFINLNVITPIKIINFLVGKFFKKMKIINITSGAANRPISGWSLYCTAKCSVKMYLDNLRIEHNKIEIFNIDPGVLDTDMQKQIRESEFDDLDIFKEYKEKKELRSPLLVAKHILDEII